MRIYDGDADRKVGGHESRVQMAKAPASSEEGGGGNREDRLLKGITATLLVAAIINLLSSRDAKSRELSRGSRLDLSIKGARVYVTRRCREW